MTKKSVHERRVARLARRRVFFIRHGRTAWNEAMRFQGRTDVPLDEAGRSQAESLAARMAGWRGLRLYSSTLSRAMETARIISEACDGTIEPRDGLVEICFGEWEGMTLPEVKSADPDYVVRWRRNPFECVPPGGETFEAIRERLAPVLDEAFEADGRVAVVCHGGIIRAALYMLLCLSGEAAWRTRLGNCSVTGVEAGKRGMSLLFVNDCVHSFVDDGDRGILPGIPFSL